MVNFLKHLMQGLVLAMLPLLVSAQRLEDYGKIGLDDLELKFCSFEKDANAMVLFDKGEIYFDDRFDIILERHKRIKIFNEKAKDEANIRLQFYATNDYEDIYDIHAQTINLKDGKQVITKLDKKQIFNERIDKNRTAFVFSFPDVQNGSVIEFRYKWKTPSFYNFPSWYFQSKLPTRYSELNTAIPDMLFYKTQYRIHQPLFKDKSSAEPKTLGMGMEAQGYTSNERIIGLHNVPSLPDEPFMTSQVDNLQCAIFQLTSIRPLGGFTQTGADTWPKIAVRLAEDEDFGLQFRKKLDDEDVLITKAKLLKTDDQKISFLFNEVKTSMKWNGTDNWYTNDGISKAWEKKTGNSTEINLILYRLLKQSDVKNVFPMIVSTRENGRANVYFPGLYQFNRTILHVPVDSTKRYFLDASDKYNLYNTVPVDVLNTFGVSMDKETKGHNIVSINNVSPAIKSIYISADILPEGKMEGTANLSDYSYHKINAVRKFKIEGVEKYKELLTERNNALKIKEMKMESAEVDSLPLKEEITFELDLPGSDGDYIYFVPNLFTGLRQNPFLSENRATLIDFGYNNKYIVTGTFRLPDGFKVDIVPKNIQLVMPDKSISFVRMIQEHAGGVNVRYILDYKKPVYQVNEYPMLREFYKQVYEMLNEQVVLKKS